MLRKIIGLILGAVASAILLGGLTTHADAQQPRSAVRRIQAEQQRRDARIKEQAARWRQEHERRLREWRLWEQRRRQKKSTGATR